MFCGIRLRAISQLVRAQSIILCNKFENYTEITKNTTDCFIGSNSTLTGSGIEKKISYFLNGIIAYQKIPLGMLYSFVLIIRQWRFVQFGLQFEISRMVIKLEQYAKNGICTYIFLRFVDYTIIFRPTEPTLSKITHNQYFEV